MHPCTAFLFCLEGRCSLWAVPTLCSMWTLVYPLPGPPRWIFGLADTSWEWREAGLPVAWLGTGGTLRLGRLAWLRSGSSHPNPNSSCPSRRAGCGGGPGSPWVGVLPFVFKQTNHEFKSGQRAAQSIKIAWGHGRCPKRVAAPLESCSSEKGGSRRVNLGTQYREQHPPTPLCLSGLWSDTRVLYGPLAC